MKRNVKAQVNEEGVKPFIKYLEKLLRRLLLSKNKTLDRVYLVYKKIKEWHHLEKNMIDCQLILDTNFI